MKFKFKLSDRRLERKLRKEAKSLSNEELRDALWIARNINIDDQEVSPEFVESNELEQNLKREAMIKEGVYAEELKKRELLEWALKTGS